MGPSALRISNGFIISLIRQVKYDPGKRIPSAFSKYYAKRSSVSTIYFSLRSSCYCTVTPPNRYFTSSPYNHRYDLVPGRLAPDTGADVCDLGFACLSTAAIPSKCSAMKQLACSQCAGGRCPFTPASDQAPPRYRYRRNVRNSAT